MALCHWVSGSQCLDGASYIHLQGYGGPRRIIQD